MAFPTFNYPHQNAYSAPTQPQYPGNISSAPMPQNGFICRPVASGLEAEAAQVDFMGPGTIMPDLAHGIVYLKRWNPQTGNTEFLVFSEQKEQTPQYATADELAELRALIEKIRKAGEDA